MSYIDKHMTESLKDHELTMIADTPDIKAFYMKRPGTRHFSILLVFTPEGIGLTGDLSIDNWGVWSMFGSPNLGWFSSQLSEDYLCGKFLKEGHWDADRAADAIAFALDPDEDVTAEREIEKNLRERDIDNPNDLYHAMSKAGLCTTDGFPGQGFDPAAAGWLCAVQQRFRELRAKQEGQGKEAEA